MKCAIKQASKKIKNVLSNPNILDKPLVQQRINNLRKEIENMAGIKPIAEFGENYAEYYRGGAEAVKKLLKERKGQVAGAFYRDDLGSIDLVWGNEKVGLKKIISKHEADFNKFGGVEKGLDEIVKDGVLIERGGVYSAWLKKGDDFYVAEFSKSWYGVGDNSWVITAYKKSVGEIPKELNADDSLNLFASAKFNELQTSSSTSASDKIITQNKKDVKRVPQNGKSEIKKDSETKEPTNDANKADAPNKAPDNITQQNDSKVSKKIESLKDEISGLKSAILEAKSWGDKVDAVFDGVADIKDKALLRVAKQDFSLAGAGLNKIAGLREFGKELDEMIGGFRVAKSAIYQRASQAKEILEHLSKDDSVMLFRALDGRITLDDLPDHLKETYAIFRNKIDENAGILVKLGALDSKYKIKDYIKRYYKQAIDERRTEARMALGKFYARKDLTPEQRLEKGLLEDADFAVANTLAEQEMQILKARTLKDFAEAFGRDEAVDSSWVRISDESVGGGIKKYGALAGKYVSKEVAEALKSSELLGREMNMYNNMYFRLIDHIKVNVTVKNPFTHVYNIGSNLVLTFLHGDEGALKDILTMMVKDRASYNKLLSQARELGLGSSLDELEGLKNLKSSKDENLIVTLAKNAYLSEGSKFGDMARKAYAWEDEIFKLARFKKNLDAGLSPKEAMKDASWAYVDYATHFNSTLRLLDKSGVMPFLHYSVKSTPVVLRAIAKNPLRFAILQAGLMLGGASSFMDNKDQNLSKPSWAQSSALPNVFGVKGWSKLPWDGWYINSGRIVPGFRFDAFDNLELGGGFVRGVLNILGGKSSLGYSFEGEDDTNLERLKKRGKELLKSYFPPLSPVGRYGQQLIQTALSKVSDKIEPVKDYNDDALGFGGVFARGLGARRFNQTKELNKENNKTIKELRSAVNNKEHKKANELRKKLDSINHQAQKMGVKLKNSPAPKLDIKFLKEPSFGR